MTAARKWLSSLMLETPAPLRALRNVPILGRLIHRLSHRIVPAQEKVWACVEKGAGKGLWIELNPRTGQQYWQGEVEPAIQDALVGLVKPGMVFYDLGANIGFFSLLAARLVGPGGRVFSFEPDPENAGRLRRNLERNEFTNATVVEAGIWSKTGNVNFIAADSHSPDRGVGKISVGENATRGTLVSCIALDDFIANAPAPDVIKCDIEGAEVEAFCGAEGIIETRHPIILCEMHSEENHRILQNYFTQSGYRLQSLDSLHVLALPQTVEQ